MQSNTNKYFLQSTTAHKSQTPLILTN